MKTSFFFVLIFFIFSQNAYNQGDTISMGKIKTHLSSEQIDEITKSEDKEAKADELVLEGNKKLRESEQKREAASKASKRKEKKKLNKEADQLENEGLKIQVQADALYEEANFFIFSVLSKKLGELIKTGNRNNATTLLTQAVKKFKEANQRRKSVLQVSDLLQRHNAALISRNVENSAIFLLKRGITFYWDPPKKDDSPQVSAQNPPKNTQTQDDGFTEDTVAAIAPTKFDPQTGEPLNTFIVIDNSQQNVPVKTNSAPPSLLFTVQIAASRMELTSTFLKTIYQLKDGERFSSELDEGWYKYSIGQFKTYAEAAEFKRNIKVQGAFVVAYKEGSRVRNIQTVITKDSVISNVSPQISTVSAKNEHSDSTKKFARKLSDVKLDFADSTLIKKRVKSNTYFSSDSTQIVFRIQIAASRLPVTETTVSKLQNVNQPINIIKSNGWYKYTIGNFTSYEEAQKFKTENNLSQTFIVKYQNDEEVK